LATINGTNTANTLNGTTSADTINALGGNDRVNGRGGNDTITGGTGYDQVTGSAGADEFVFRLGDAISSEPHDAIMDFQVGVDRVQFASGGVIGFEDDPEGIWVNYGSSASSWFQLRGVQSITEAQLTGSGGGTSPPPPPPPPTGGGAPFPTGVSPTYAEEFTTGWGSWYHNWQSEEGIQQTGRGTILIGGSSSSGSGIMSEPPGNPASGFGDGLYQIRARMEGPGLGSGSGPALVLWPADDRWPGPEIDIGEIGGGGDLYMATHWNNNGQDAYNIYSAPGVDWRQWHEYAARLETNRITYYVDGRQIGVETQHPAPEYGEGGVNHIPSVMNRSSETMLEVDYFRFTDESALV
jgi:hypothetical protein